MQAPLLRDHYQVLHLTFYKKSSLSIMAIRGDIAIIIWQLNGLCVDDRSRHAGAASRLIIALASARNDPSFSHVNLRHARCWRTCTSELAAQQPIT
jgi:hypothetical protein